MRTSLLASLLFASLALSTSSRAAEVNGVKLADKVTVGGTELVLNGAGVRTKVVFQVYVGSLYTTAKTTTLAGAAKGPRRIQMNMLRGLSAKTLLEALEEGLKDNNTAAELTAIKAETDQLSAIMKSFGDLKEGHVVTLDFADGTTTISLNGKSYGTVAGDAFNKALLKIWLGDKPVQDDLKKKMLGQ